MTGRIHSIVVNGLKGVLLLWFVLHFTLTVLYVMPLNAIKIRLYPLLNATIGTYFNQNWSLFAPDPLSQDISVLIQPRITGDSTIVNNDSWYNISYSLWDKFHQNRFTAYDRLARSQTNASRKVFNGGNHLIPFLKSCENGDTIACRIYEKLLVIEKKSAKERLVVIASAFLKDIGVFDEYKFIAIRVRVTSYPPWSKRHTGKSSWSDIEIGVFPAKEGIIASGVFR